MKQDAGLPEMSAANSLVKKYSDTLPFSDTVKAAEAPGTVRHYCPPCEWPEPEFPPAPAPAPNISFKAFHTLQKLIDNISENIAFAYELAARTRNRQAHMILRDYIGTGEEDLLILRGIYKNAAGVSPPVVPFVPVAGFSGNTALRAMFANETQILEDLQILKEDRSMLPYLNRLNYVTAAEIDELRRIGLLDTL